MDLEQFRELKIPQRQEERDKVLTDALKAENPLLIEFALAIGARPQKGGVNLLEYAVKQGNLELTQKLVPYIEDGKSIAMKMAIVNDQIEIATWLSNEGTVMNIGQKSMQEHSQTVRHLLTQKPEAKTNIYYGALLQTIFFSDGAELLTMILNSMKKNSPEAIRDSLIKLADDTVDTDRVECMGVMVKFGLDVRYVNTKYCQNEKMRKFLKENGARID